MATTVIGAGSWGTALAILLARNGYTTHLWGRNAAQMQAMATDRCNQRYLPDSTFPEKLLPQADLQQALAGADAVLVAVPSHAFGQQLQVLKPYLSPGVVLLWATKGLDPASGQLLQQTASEILPETIPLGVLSGPSFAKEVAADMPTAITLATQSDALATLFTERLHNPNFRVYRSEDLAGVQICGAVKNVLAIATGISDGLGFGANARCALITRGLAEMTRLGLALGAKQHTFLGLAGVGDLVLTCTDNQSRNRRMGLALGAGKTITAAQAEIGQVVEGLQTVTQVLKLAKQHQLEMPITEQIDQIVNHGVSPQQAEQTLLARVPGVE